MITKAIVEEIISPYSIRVRIPILNAIQGAQNSTPTSELSAATICTIPNARNNVQIGDIVFVGFEDNDLSKPIILGHLFKENNDNRDYTGTLLELMLNSIAVQFDASLPENTYIGEVQPSELQMLRGQTSNIKDQFDSIIKDIDTIKSKLGM